MSRFIFLLLLVANAVVGVHLYLLYTQPTSALPDEINADQLKIIAATDAAKAQAEAASARKIIESLSGAACVELSVKPADGARAQSAFAALPLGDRLSSRNVEEFTRFAIATPVQRDRKTADALLASFKRANVKDVSIMADNTISLGVFSSDEAARRTLSELENKVATLMKGASITPKNAQAKEIIFTIREADAMMLARLALLQGEYAGSSLRGASCPDSPETASVSVSNEKTKP